MTLSDLSNEEVFDYCEEEEEDPNSTDEGSRSMSFDDMSEMPNANGKDKDEYYKDHFLPMIKEMKKSFEASKFRLSFYQMVRPRLLKKCPNILKDPKAIKEEYHNCWINHIRKPGYELGW
jgi:hypothetical protein